MEKPNDQTYLYSQFDTSNLSILAIQQTFHHVQNSTSTLKRHQAFRLFPATPLRRRKLLLLQCYF